MSARALLPTRELGKTGMQISAVGSAPGPSVAAIGRLAGAPRTTPIRSLPSAMRSTKVSTGSTPPRCTVSDIPRKSSNACSQVYR